MTSPKSTPMMIQWSRCKEQVGNALLLFRLGDFYEAFGEDAKIASQALELTLTKRQDVPMCGIPWHASENYIDRLLVKGFCVAIAEQVVSGDSVKLMERQVVRILSPATTMKGSLIQDSSNSLLVCLATNSGRWGMAIVDVTTALFQVCELDDVQNVYQEILRLQPKEIVCSQATAKHEASLFDMIENAINLRKSVVPNWAFEPKAAITTLQTHFKVVTTDGLGLRDGAAATCAAGAVLTYLKDVLLVPTDHLTTIEFLANQKTMHLDRATLQNLDIFESGSQAHAATSLFDVLNQTKTPMGARLLRSWLLNPLLDIAAIYERQECVDGCLQFLRLNSSAAETAKATLTSIRDIERLILRIKTGGAGPRDVLFLAHCCAAIAPLKNSFYHLPHHGLNGKIQAIKPLDSLIQQIQTTITDEPPLRISDGGAIRPSIHPELSELTAIRQNNHEWLLAYQTRLREELGIKTLKVGYNRAFGYFIEVSKGQADRMPSSFARRQTLTGAERYISEELKSYEDKVLTAEKRIEGIEAQVFADLTASVSQYAEDILSAARTVAEVDVYMSLASVAYSQNYCRPTISDTATLDIIEGRHPIAETQRLATPFVPNDIAMSATGPSLLLITGPNMAGKSTFVRQIALLTIMAQIGSFIPASEARIGIVDRVFSRVGASDDLFRGQSTFMVEMAETASILRQATPKSLILLDEIGRGTSTYDGISIAWAVAEYLIRNPQENPRTLFATHYFELTQLADRFSVVRNMTVAVSEQADTIRFLYRVIPGTADRSYGVHVAKLAGLPPPVIARAESMLAELESKCPKGSSFVQVDLFAPPPKPSPLSGEALACVEFLKKLDLTKTSPLDCFVKLVTFKNSALFKLG